MRLFKIVICGDIAVGKTSIRRRYLGEGFQTNYILTLGADFAVTNYKDTKLQIWDLAGQEGFQFLLKEYYIGAHAGIVVFDVTNRETLKKLSYWIENFALTKSGDKVPMIIVGNKIDLRTADDDTITTNEAVEFVNELSHSLDWKFTYIETSALTGENVRSTFENLIDGLLSVGTI
ncbi:MAG: Rab family GTPase [Candidatus Kariarchaeaceae archaeon]|jgi:small GTP-binding protein